MLRSDIFQIMMIGCRAKGRLSFGHNNSFTGFSVYLYFLLIAFLLLLFTDITFYQYFLLLSLINSLYIRVFFICYNMIHIFASWCEYMFL